MAGVVSDPRPVAADSALVDGVETMVEAVKAAAAARTTLVIRGGGTKAWYGHRVDAPPVDASAHSGIVEYEPSELVIVARAGTPLREVEAVLARDRQMLAFEPPHFAPPAAATLPGGDDALSRALQAASRGATIGGCVATGLSGPRRMAAGAVRDFVLGVRVIDGRGQHLAFGGRVMKNVAGYDMSRALVGSLGTLGILTEVALKVLPIPMQTVTLSFTIDEAAALEQMNRWAGLPIAITASAWTSRPSSGPAAGPYASRGGRMLIRLEGSEAAVQSGIRRIGGLDVEPAEASAAWLGMREQTDAFFAGRPVDRPLWRVALPPTAPPLDAATLGFEAQRIEWGGALRWIATPADGTLVRDAASRLGGHATLWRASEEIRSRHGVFTPLSATSLAIHRRLKDTFDPAGVFNSGRLYPDL